MYLEGPMGINLNSNRNIRVYNIVSYHHYHHPTSNQYSRDGRGSEWPWMGYRHKYKKDILKFNNFRIKLNWKDKILFKIDLEKGTQ